MRARCQDKELFSNILPCESLNKTNLMFRQLFVLLDYGHLEHYDLYLVDRQQPFRGIHRHLQVTLKMEAAGSSEYLYLPSEKQDVISQRPVL
jgi:hypothetical protein